MSPTCCPGSPQNAFGIGSSIVQDHILSKTNSRYRKVQHFPILIGQTYFSRSTNNICPGLAAASLDHRAEYHYDSGPGQSGSPRGPRPDVPPRCRRQSCKRLSHQHLSTANSGHTSQHHLIWHFPEASGVTWLPWISMDIHGFSMDYPWISMDIHR